VAKRKKEATPAESPRQICPYILAVTALLAQENPLHRDCWDNNARAAVKIIIMLRNSFGVLTGDDPEKGQNPVADAGRFLGVDVC